MKIKQSRLLSNYLIKICILLIVTLCIIACPTSIGGVDGDGSGTVEPPVIGPERNFWGSWVRMDGANETWYMASNGVAISNGDKSGVSSSSVDGFVLGSSTVLKQTDNVLEITPATGQKFFLFRRSGVNATGILRVSSLSDAGLDSRPISGLGSIEVIVSNINNPGNSQTHNPGSSGDVDLEELIIGDTYSVTVSVQNGENQSVVAAVNPVYDGENLGTIGFGNTTQNFKVSYSPRRSYLYAEEDYSLTISIENIGTTDMQQANYLVTQPDGLFMSGGKLQDILGTVQANGGKKNINFTVRADAFTDEYRIFTIPVQVKATVGTDEWNDSISLKIFRESQTLYIRSKSSAVQGILITPENRSFSINTGVYYTPNSYFVTDGWAGDITFPVFDQPSIIALSGANYSSETKYALKLGSRPYDAGEALTDAGQDEPNNNENQTTSFFKYETRLGYLGNNDLDFFTVYSMQQNDGIVFDPPQGTYDATQTVALINKTGIGQIYYTLDGTEPTITSAIYSTPIVITSQVGTKTIKAKVIGGAIADTVIFASSYQFALPVTFNSQGGTIVDAQQVAYGGVASAPIAPTKPGTTTQGYSVAGWYREAECINQWNFSTDVVTTALTLYAKWELVPYIIGMVGPAGGIVFYDKGNFADGWQFLEAWIADETGTFSWKLSLTDTVGGSEALGAGYTNTYSALAGDGYPAAERARDVTYSGFTDWHLPSRYELYELYYQKGSVGGFSSSYYWSSTESGISTAWAVGFPTFIQSMSNKTSLYKVRVIRAF